MQSVADTLCRQLGQPTPGRLVDTSAYGPGAGPVLLNYVSCPNNGTSLEDCEFSLKNVRCDHSHDVGLICGAPASKWARNGGLRYAGCCAPAADQVAMTCS